MTNFQRKLRYSDGRLPGFEVLRAVLVAALIVLQSIQVSVSYGYVLATPFWLLLIAVPAALFFLAGFALTTSAESVTLRVFLQRRAVRLLPIVLVAIVLSAFVVGLAATESTRRVYLTDADLWLFPIKVLLMMQARLPGLFEFNNEPWTVGANFWMITATVVGCGLLAVASRPRWRWPALLVGAGGLLLAAIVILLMGSDLLSVGRGSVATGAALSGMACFVFGASAVYLRRHIPCTFGLALGAGGILGGVAYFGSIRWQGNGLFDLLVALPIAYLTLFAASQRAIFTRMARSVWPAMSGLPLFGFTLQQFWIAKGSAQQSAFVNLALSLPPAMMLSFMVHFLVQRRIVPKWFPALATEPMETTDAAFSTQNLIGGLRQHLAPRAVAQQLQAMVPRLFGAALFLLVVFGLMALMMLAMQRDEAGI